MRGSPCLLILGLLLAVAVPVVAVGAVTPVTKPLSLDEIVKIGLRGPVPEPATAVRTTPTIKPVALSDNELDTYRGGYSPAPDLNYQFGAVLKTFQDGQLALETTLNVSPTGNSIQQTAGAGVTAGTVIGNVDLAGAVGGAFSTPGGTTFVQNVANGQLINMILTTDSNHTYNQQTSVTLVLPGFADVQSQILRNLTGFRLSLDAGAGTIRSLNH
jgi:hypothetical protein